MDANAHNLPVYEIERDLLAALRGGNRVVLTAPTGSGKTTQVPQMLLRAGDAASSKGGQIVVLQPRRLAARLVAGRVAAELGGEVGGLVGYQTRHDSKISSATRIRFMTEGLLLRLLRSNPTLAGIGTVILDEFHERNLASDAALALGKLLQESRRPDLKLVVMSATLDARLVSRYLACPSLEAGGRLYPVELHYLEKRNIAPPWDLAADALAAALSAEGDGPKPGSEDGNARDVLIFMPGAYEIRRTIDVCRRETAGRGDLAFFPLHGELPAAQQDAAVRPHADGRGPRKVIVATNVAETSITIPGIRYVIDSGLARVSRFDPRRGINVLLVEPISQASAAQRSGRAGRTAPGSCYRLWTAAEDRGRPAQGTPEVQRLDLAEVVLQLQSFGVRDVARFPWLEPPPALAVAQAVRVLEMLGAVEEDGGQHRTSNIEQPTSKSDGGSADATVAGSASAGSMLNVRSSKFDVSAPSSSRTLTPLGELMADLPMHPRLSRLLVEAGRRGSAELLDRAALWAALLSERDILLRGAGQKFAEEASGAAGPRSDFLVLERAFAAARAARFDPDRCTALGVHANACRELEKTWRLFREAGADVGPAVPAGTVTRAPKVRSGKTQLAGTAGPTETLLKCLLVAFPDHVALRRGASNLSCALVGNRRGVLDGQSVAQRPGLVLALDIREVGAGQAVKTVLSLASAIEPAWLAEVHPRRVTQRRITRWNADAKAVEEVEQHAFDDLVYEETARPDANPDEAARILAEEVLAGRLKLEHWDATVEQWIARTRCVAAWFPERKLITYDDDDRRVILQELGAGATRYSQVRDRRCYDAVRGALSWDDQQFVERMAPDRIQLPGGWRMKIEYEIAVSGFEFRVSGSARIEEDAATGPPQSETRNSKLETRNYRARGRAKIQDLYGLRESPRVAGGRVAVVLEILGPNFRPVQVTEDLAGFWRNLYPTLKKELARKYPRHEWR